MFGMPRFTNWKIGVNRNSEGGDYSKAQPRVESWGSESGEARTVIKELQQYIFFFSLIQINCIHLTFYTSGTLDSRDYEYCIIIINIISIVSIQLISCHINKKLSYLILSYLILSYLDELLNIKSTFHISIEKF